MWWGYCFKVIKDGAYYGLYSPKEKMDLYYKNLPINYCRSRFSIGNQPAVEFQYEILLMIILRY